MNSDLFITLTGCLILIGILVILVRKLLLMLRHLRNQFRDTMGKNSAELDKAVKIMEQYQKGGLIPKWASDDAIKTLKKYYNSQASLNAVVQLMQNNGIKVADFPRSYYIEPGTTKEKLSEACFAHFKSFDMKAALSENGSMTQKDFKTFTYLSYMWYFADDAVKTQAEAMAQVREAFGMFCEKYGGMQGSSIKK